MAIALDATTQNKTQSADPSFSHTCTGTNLVLLVAVSVVDSIGIAGVTYNGVSMSIVNSEVNNLEAGDDVFVSLWSLTNPATGAHTVAIDSGTTPASICYAAMSFTGVDQTTSIEASQVAQGDTNAPTVDVTTLTNNALVVDVLGQKGASSSSPTLTKDASQTEIWNQVDQAVGFTRGSGAGSYESKATAGTVTMSWSSSQSTGWGMVAAALKPAGGSSTSPSASLSPSSSVSSSVSPSASTSPSSSSSASVSPSASRSPSASTSPSSSASSSLSPSSSVSSSVSPSSSTSPSSSVSSSLSPSSSVSSSLSPSASVSPSSSVSASTSPSASLSPSASRSSSTSPSSSSSLSLSPSSSISASPSSAITGKSDDITAEKQFDSLVTKRPVATEIVGIKKADNLTILPKKGDDNITVTP